MRFRVFGLMAFAAAVVFFFTLTGTAHVMSVQAGVQTAPAANAANSPMLSEKNPAMLAQLMRGIMLPNSNVIFFAESKDPAAVPQAKNASGAINPLEGVYGHWEAVENSSLAIAEASNLLEVQGRVCSNGRPVPTNKDDWAKLVKGLREAGIRSYLAAKSKDQDKLNDAGDLVTTACSNCHVKYRDTAKLEDRCK
jgi:hypothetical protein